MAEGLKRKAARAGAWAAAKRLVKPIPVVGTAFVLGSAGYELRKKGLMRGAAHVGLDLIPVVGTAKAVVELFTGDLIPDKDRSVKPRALLPAPVGHGGDGKS
ncbi:MAG TPA: hypothetical protein VFS10_00850 [Pyrinomonadaceae bacterium]|nr:hypothetical protein [Pyrinomonadaceae bacterium]